MFSAISYLIIDVCLFSVDPLDQLVIERPKISGKELEEMLLSAEDKAAKTVTPIKVEQGVLEEAEENQGKLYQTVEEYESKTELTIEWFCIL